MLTFAIFLLDLAFNLISFFILLRFILQCVKVSYYHPFVQSLVKLTNPIVLPIRRITPILGPFDWSCILAVICIDLFRYTLLILTGYFSLSPLIVFGLVILDILYQFLIIYCYLFIALALLSWVSDSPKARILLDLVKQATRPITKYFKKPLNHKGFSFIPLVIMIILLIGLFFISRLQQYLTVGL